MPATLSVDDVEDHVVPLYLTSNYDAVQAKKKQQRIEALYLKKRPREGAIEAKWKIQDVDHNEWRQNVIDKRTIYNMHEDSISGPRELPKMSAKTVTDGSLNDVTAQRAEFEYIKEMRQRMPSAGISEKTRFSSQILSVYNKPPQRSVSPSYCAPAGTEPANKIRTLDQLIGCLHNQKAAIKIPRKRYSAMKCTRTNMAGTQFCDVLGPVACNLCIEATNKRIARAVEKASFPELDCSIQSLIAPKLAKILLKGSMVPNPENAGPQRQVSMVTSLPEIPHKPRKGYSYGRAGIERRFEGKAKMSSLAAGGTTKVTYKHPALGKYWSKVQDSFFDI